MKIKNINIINPINIQQLLLLQAVTYCHTAIASNGNAQPSGNVFSALYFNFITGEFKMDVTTDVVEEMTVRV
jgi:hypothetical protein